MPLHPDYNVVARRIGAGTEFTTRDTSGNVVSTVTLYGIAANAMCARLSAAKRGQ